MAKKNLLFLLFLFMQLCMLADHRFEFEQIPASPEKKQDAAALEEDRAFSQPHKPNTFLVYMAADNDLYPFAYRNLAQMKQVGSNNNLNILVHLDIRSPNQPKVTKRLYIERDKIWQIGPDYHMDSGSDLTLINALEWALTDFSSDNVYLVLWNHGSGDLNPVLRKTINPAQLFKFNPETRMIELNRSIGFIDFVDQITAETEVEQAAGEEAYCARGICFDETNGTYLDDKKLVNATNVILHMRGGKKIDLVAFDACLMAGTGTCYLMNRLANYMTASEEVEMGTGYDYLRVLTPLAQGTLTPEDFAKHIVQAYQATYERQTGDYTHSALKLSEFENLHNNIDQVAHILIDALHKQSRKSVKQVLQKSRSRQYCTAFDEPSYIDLHNFYSNLLQFLNQIVLTNQHDTNNTIQALKKALTDGLAIIKRVVIANVAGPKLPGASGISIFFPEYRIDSPSYQSYDATEFALNNHWAQFLRLYFVS